MTRLAWKVFISSKACRLIVILWQEFIRHLFGKLLFPFVSLDTAISYKAKKVSNIPSDTPDVLPLLF